MFCLEQLIAFVKPKTEHCCHCGERWLTTLYPASQNRTGLKMQLHFTVKAIRHCDREEHPRQLKPVTQALHLRSPSL